MIPLVIFVFIATTPQINALSAHLKVVQYDPLVFELSFSQSVNRPDFQLLFNNVQNIPYHFLTNQTAATSFLLQANTEGIQDGADLQMYDLMFNNPLAVGNGKLQISSYSLEAQKGPVEIDFPSALGILILIGAYFFNFFTEIGKLLIEFIHVYLLYMFHSNMQTSTYRQLYIGLMIIPPRDILEEETFDRKTYLLMCLLLPVLILFVFALTGYLIKKCAPKERSILGNIVYQELVFCTFIKVSNIFLFNLLFNSIQFGLMLTAGTVPYAEEIRGVGGTLVYFNIITFISIIYLKLFIMNPKYGQSEESWKQYLQSELFMDFRQLHQKIHLTPWYNRNFFFLNSFKNFLLVLVFFWDSMFQYLILVIQFLHIFTVFTLRPFKEEFYLNLKVITRLLFLVEYILIVLGNLYFSMGPVTFNYGPVSSYVIAREVIFLVLVFGVFIAIFFQIYFKCTNLSYNINLVKQANQYKLELVDQNRKKEDSSIKRHPNTIYSDKRSVSSRAVETLSDTTNPSKRNKKDSELRKELLGGREKVARGKTRSKIEQIQMVYIKDQRDAEKHQSLQHKHHRERNGDDHKHKWKKQSLLEEIVQKK